MNKKAFSITEAAEFHQQGKLEDAEAAYRALLQNDPKNFDATHLLGVLFLQRGDAEAATRQIGLAIGLNPSVSQAHYNLGAANSHLQRHAEALASYDRAIALEPSAESYLFRGNTLRILARPEDALASYDKAVALRPKFAEAHYGRGNVLRSLARPEEAVEAFTAAIALNPRFAEVYVRRGSTFIDMAARDPVKQVAAVKDFERALAINPAIPFVEGVLLHARMGLCDWQGYDAACKNLVDKIEKAQPVTFPFTLVALPSTPEQQLKCARLYASRQYPTQPPVWKGERYVHDKIRIAYVSADFHVHATAHLMVGLFEAHNRAKFEITALSFGPDDGSKTRKRLEAGFDNFINASRMSDEQIAKTLREREIDIAIDLKGYTQEARFGIFSRRGAPLQVNYLGYPGTTGAPYIDYIIADRALIPPQLQPFYSEQVALLPDCYQPTDNKRVVAPETPTRAAAGLPETGFVFCSFNNPYKITPDVFAVWMKIVQAVPGSVLWLLQPPPVAVANLQAAAKKHGLDPARLVFAPRMPQEKHLARHRLADLFIDTLPCNAHTTASDALWMGLPLVTVKGETFASRVAASVLAAAGIPELAVNSFAEYEQLALKLAREPEMLAGLKTKLTKNRDSCALFDTARYTRNLEALFTKMWERQQQGLAPESISL